MRPLWLPFVVAPGNACNENTCLGKYAFRKSQKESDLATELRQYNISMKSKQSSLESKMIFSVGRLSPSTDQLRVTPFQMNEAGMMNAICVRE